MAPRNPSPTMYVQRGNFTSAVQWRGDNVDEIREFVLNRGVDEVIVPEMAESPDQKILLMRAGRHVLPALRVDYWLVDQFNFDRDTPVDFVICGPTRFSLLYREVPDATSRPDITEHVMEIWKLTEPVKLPGEP